MAKYITYASHKATNITGLENIPEHWEIKQVRYLLLDGQDGIKIGPFGSALKLEDMVEAGYKVYGQENVIKKDFSLGKRWISENKFNAMQVYRVHSGDILITMMGTSGKCEIVPDDHQTGIIDSHLIRLGLQKDKMLPKFFKVLIDGTLEIEYQVKIQGKGSIMHGLNSSIIKSLELPIPPLSEQKDILNFLDFETAQIDTLIEKQQTLIQLLKEKRQAVISHAVTKGLNPDAPMKDSGVEWLGEVPEHWEVKGIKRLSEIKRGASPRPIADQKYFDDEGEYAWTRIADVSRAGMYLDTTTQRLSDLGAALSVKLEAGELFLSIAGTVGKPCITISKACIHDGFVYFPTLKINNKFLFYIFEAGQAYLGLGKMGTQLNLNTETVGGIEIGLPPKKEIEAIIKYIEDETARFDHLIDKAEQAIQLMQERRTALISAAVTGKIDVRGWTAPDIEVGT
ncbi:restriction endonuclease subunit S [Psychrobacter sp. HII-4]|uniref:restriction endonuclease subunit S n=1 Tax=Psychrobacter sp. HII-4 TaxID=1569264 RepID=UPI001918AAFD|nr:restriction endonuclease subunit S [Psychrobacter sp. HII-4]